MNYYQTLEVQESATAEEIKKAFKRLSSVYHPDKPTGDASKFRQIVEAYNTLSSIELKTLYDIKNAIRNKPKIDLNDMFGDFWVSMGKNPNIPRQETHNTSPPNDPGDDITENLTISTEESLVGCKKTIKIVSSKPNTKCNTCGGDGAKPGTRKATCYSCNGLGRNDRRHIRPCTTCHGLGTIPIIPCQACLGVGKVISEVERTIIVPAGISDSQQLRIAGGGSPGHPPGDLYVTIKIKFDENMWRDGPDLHIKQSITLKHAILGGTVDLLPGLQFTVSPGTQPGDIHTLLGKGAINPLSKIPGDLVVHINVQLPKSVSNRGKKLLEEFMDELTRSPLGK